MNGIQNCERRGRRYVRARGGERERALDRERGIIYRRPRPFFIASLLIWNRPSPDAMAARVCVPAPRRRGRTRRRRTQGQHLTPRSYLPFFAGPERSWSPQAGRWHVNCGDAALQDGSLRSVAAAQPRWEVSLCSASILLSVLLFYRLARQLIPLSHA